LLWKNVSFFLAHPFATVSVTLPAINMNTDASSTLLLSEGQMGEAWAPSDKSDTHFCIGEHQKRKATLLFFVPRAINLTDTRIRKSCIWSHARYRQRSPYSKQKPRTFLLSSARGGPSDSHTAPQSAYDSLILSM